MAAALEPILLDPVEPPASPEERRSSAARVWLLPVARRRGTVLLAMLVGTALGIASGAAQPNIYRSEGKLLVRWGAREEVTPEAVLVERGRDGGSQPRDVVNNELQLLRDPQVFERAAREVTPRRIFAPYDPEANDDQRTPLHKRLLHRLQSWWFDSSSTRVASRSGHTVDDCAGCVTRAAEVLRSDASLEGAGFSSVITVSYAAHDAALAQVIVSALLDSAEQQHRVVYSTDPTLEFLSVRVTESRAELEKAEQAFNAFRAEHDLDDYETRRQELVAASLRLQQQMAEDATALAELRSRSAALVALMAEVPTTMVQQVERSPLVNPKWSVLQQLLFHLQTSLDDLTSQVGGTTAAREAERTRLEKRMRAVLADLEREPDLIERTTAEQTVANPRYERLKQQFDDVALSMKANDATTAQRAERLERVRRDLKAIEARGPAYRELEARLREAEASHADFEKAHRSTGLMNLLDQMDLSNLRRIQDATLPFEKVGPRRGKLAFVGLVLGTLLGITLAFVGHAIDPYVRSPQEVERLLGLRVLEIVPHARLPRRTRPLVRRAAS